MGISYRLADIADCRELARLKKDVWNTTYRGIYSDAKIDGYDMAGNVSAFESIVRNPDVKLYAAADGGKIAGFMSCGAPRRPFADFKQEIGLLYILKDYQRKGIGRALFSIGKEEIKRSGADEFFISVNKYNKNALDFYVSMGGEIIHVDEDKDDRSQAQIKLRYGV